MKYNNKKEKEDNNLPKHTPNPHSLIFTPYIENIPLWKERWWWSEKKIVEIKETVEIDLRKR